MTFLITGGAGFIGSHFVQHMLTCSDERIINLDRLSYAGHLQNIRAFQGDPRHTFVHGDIADHAQMRALLREHRPRAVINVAAETHVDRSIESPDPFMQHNTVGTFRLLESVQAYWATLPAATQAGFRFLQVSTDEVYGALTAEAPAFTEGDPYAPNSPYAASKAAADHWVRAWWQTYGLPVLTTHCSNNYGPAQFPEKLIPRMIVNALRGDALPVYGDGRHVRDWLYVEDHCRALARVLGAGRVGQAYNIGAGNERANIDIVNAVCALLDALRPRADGASYTTQIQSVADRLGHDRRYALDTTKIRTELGWHPVHAFDDGLRTTVQWYLDHSGL